MRPVCQNRLGVARRYMLSSVDRRSELFKGRHRFPKAVYDISRDWSFLYMFIRFRTSVPFAPGMHVSNRKAETTAIDISDVYSIISLKQMPP